MALTLTLSSSLTIFSTFLLLSATVAKPAAVNTFCTSATDGTQCDQLIKGAANWEQAMTNVLSSAIDIAKAKQTVVYNVASKLPKNLEPQTKSSIESTCKEAFDTLISNLEKCKGYVKDDPTSSLKFYLGSMTLFDCQNALEEFGVSLPEVTALNDEIVGMNSNFMAVLNTNSAYA